LAIAVTPTGDLAVRRAGPSEGDPVDEEAAARIIGAFATGAGPGLLQLGTAEVETRLPPGLGYWRDLAARYVAAVCARGERRCAPMPQPDPDTLAALAAGAPPMTGGEYVTGALLAEQWLKLDEAFLAAVGDDDVAAFLRARHTAWNLIGRVCFNL